MSHILNLKLTYQALTLLQAVSYQALMLLQAVFKIFGHNFVLWDLTFNVVLPNTAPHQWCRRCKPLISLSKYIDGYSLFTSNLLDHFAIRSVYAETFLFRSCWIDLVFYLLHEIFVYVGCENEASEDGGTVPCEKDEYEAADRNRNATYSECFCRIKAAPEKCSVAWRLP
ncbi:hypothetical protein RIF29_29942 [Crotalaria pallida]|uniref:Uncharacterized protein n=1 Tax=Crotalaria pallida TaxID=3830 RepID=A0AAN9EFS4_CROPI